MHKPAHPLAQRSSAHAWTHMHPLTRACERVMRPTMAACVGLFTIFAMYKVCSVFSNPPWYRNCVSDHLPTVHMHGRTHKKQVSFLTMLLLVPCACSATLTLLGSGCEKEIIVGDHSSSHFKRATFIDHSVRSLDLVCACSSFP